MSETSQHALLPHIYLTERQLADLEQLLNGGFAPLKGFLNEDDYRQVVSDMHLSSGELWPIPIVLDQPADTTHAVGDKLVLCDAYGNPLAMMEISSVYRPDKYVEAMKVYGTTEKLHPGVKHLFDDTGDVYFGGSVQRIAQWPVRDFEHLRYGPSELKEFFRSKGWNKVIAFQTRNPMHKAHYELVNKAVAATGAHLLIHPVVGTTKEGDINYIYRVRSYEALINRYFKEGAKLSLLSISMRMAGPREALWHALIRKNYGATHFIIGRDHAGPGNDSAGKPFYEPYAAQKLAKKYESELGVQIVCSKELAFDPVTERYVEIEEIGALDGLARISGSQFREMLRLNHPVPEWFTFPEVLEELRKSIRAENGAGVVIFFTGLSGSGKSTVAHLVRNMLVETYDRRITLLDGDIIRRHLSKGLGFSKEDRITNIERIGFVASEIAKHGGVTICAAIAPYRSVRNMVRKLVSKHGVFIEVHLSTPLEVCESRDSKGLYKQARAGLVKNFTGIDDPYEAPEDAEMVIDTSNVSATDCAKQIISYLEEHNLLAH